MLISVLIGIPSTVGMIVFAKPILELLFPNQPSGELLLQISSVSITFIMLNQNINAILHGLGKTVVPTIILVAGSTIKLILNTILVQINPNEFIFNRYTYSIWRNSRSSFFYSCKPYFYLLGLYVYGKKVCEYKIWNSGYYKANFSNIDDGNLHDIYI